MAESGNLSINLHWEDGELSVSTEMPERERTTRFLAVMRNFLDDRDKLHYKKIWKILKSDFSDEIQSDKIRFIDEAVVRLENGAVQIAVNDKVYSPKEIFRLLSSAGSPSEKLAGADDRPLAFFSRTNRSIAPSVTRAPSLRSAWLVV